MFRDSWFFGGGMGWWMTFGWVFWIAVIAAIVWVVSRSARTGGANEDSPETILKRRYARGEIDRQEYEQRLADLRK